MSSGSSKSAGAAASWFPGHMAAGLRAVMDVASIIDVVVEVRDARLPRTTAVARLHQQLKTKRTIVLLNRKDLAEDAATRDWLRHLSDNGTEAFAGSGTHAATLRNLRAALSAHNGRRARTRVAVVGAPNTGKSSVINSLVRRKRTIVQDKAGVTRYIRWIPLDDRVDILDTPGVLAPKITNRTTAWQLALCGILPESAFDVDEVIEQFVIWIAGNRPSVAGKVDLESFSRQRGMLRRGGEIDRRNAAGALLKEFRAGKLGRFTFELAGERK